MTASLLHWLELFLLPPGIILVLLLSAWMFSGRRPLLSYVLSVSGILLLVFLSMPLIARYLLINLQDYPVFETVAQNDDTSSGVIVILGAGRYPVAPEYGFRDEISSLTLERLRYGAFLAGKLKMPVLLSGGRRDSNATSEAVLMNQVMVNVFNNNPQYLDIKGINTHQQAIEVRKILSSKSDIKIYLVTHAWHMKRAVKEFSLQGLDVYAAPMGFAATSTSDNLYLPSATAMASSSRALHEYYALLYLNLMDQFAP